MNKKKTIRLILLSSFIWASYWQLNLRRDQLLKPQLRDDLRKCLTTYYEKHESFPPAKNAKALLALLKQEQLLSERQLLHISRLIKFSYEADDLGEEWQLHFDQ